ncbi:MAG TPA: sulfonate ABC transporter substrate-binding protein, partial [Actinophytocola sp.]|nr:sulfonate ABC transporter substrate-binding protein [Actinophytocola sp.]
MKEGNTMKRLLTGIAAATLLLGACAPSTGSDDDTEGGGGGDRVTLTLNWVPYGEHAPFYYGVEKGFYEAEGIDL